MKVNMKEKTRNLLYRASVPVVGVATAILLPCKAFASDASSLDAITTTMTNSFTEIGASIMSMIGKVLPIALPVIGAVMVIVFGVKIFKKVTGKA